MNTRELASVICGDVVQGVHEVRGRTFIVTTIPYPSGDLITLYVSERAGETFVSDQGMTAFYLASEGVDLTDARRATVASICVLHDVRFDGQTLERQIRPTSAGADVLSLCQAIIRVSDLHYDRSGRKVPPLAMEVESLIAAKIAPRRAYVANWTDPELDPKRAHPVDYHFNGRGVPSNVFVIASSQRVDAVTSIIQFWQKYVGDFKSLCIVAEGLRVTQKSGDRLRTAANGVVRGVGRSTPVIVGFALSETRYTPTVMVTASIE